MEFQKIRRMAKAMDINTYHMKKVDMIRAIQDGENNIPCFGTPRIDSCGEDTCLWRTDCVSFNGLGSVNPKT
ncbi:conserved hypothetical protein [delta proteobacterium NaphS2]|nr:conserved hypothetical protein [delta proteobacterium NaphS2]